MSYVFLSLEQLLQLQVILVYHSGGSIGVRDIGRLEAALSAQSQDVFGRELYESVYAKAAVLMRGIVQDHPFVDANKRTAMLAGMTFLSLNGVACHMTQKELEDFAVRIAVDHLSVEDIAAWLRRHSGPRQL